MIRAPGPRRAAGLIWTAEVAAALVLLLASAVVPEPAAPSLVGVMRPTAAGLSVLAVALSWLWAVRLRPVVPPGFSPPSADSLALTRLIVASALCEASGLFALVAYLGTQDLATLLAFGLSFVGLLTHRPGDRHWARLGGTAAAPGAGRRPMVRG